MKYLSIVIPCDQGKDIKQTIESCLILKEDVEVILLSCEHHDQRCRDYEGLYPQTITYVEDVYHSQGEAIELGLKNATGQYFYILNNEHVLEQSSLVKLLETMKLLHQQSEVVDLFVTNRVYQKQSMTLAHVFPQKRIARWYNLKHFHFYQYMLYDHMIYRTQLLRNCYLQLPECHSGIEQLFVYLSLPYVNTMYYLNIDLCNCLKDNELILNKEMIASRLKVNQIMIDSCDIMSLKSRKLRHYMIKFLAINLLYTTVLTIRFQDKDLIWKKDALWSYLEEIYPSLYQAIIHTFVGRFTNLDKNFVGQKMMSLSLDFFIKFLGE